VLVELSVVEQRYRAVLEVLNEGATVTDVARRCGVARQTVHGWLRRYATDGLAGLVDRSARPESCPHQMPAVVEAGVVELRRAHPGWGPRTILTRLAMAGVEPLPSRSGVYRALVRHGLIEPTKRRRRRGDYKRWERSRSMELWQMDVVGRIYLSDGTELSAVTGVDDHSRFCVIAKLVRRATARPVCDALVEGLARHGVPDQILTDNGKVFTGRFGTGPGPVLFDRICAENGIRHLLTAPYSPTTTGKVERFHKTLRDEHLSDQRFDTIDAAQVALDVWVDTYNSERPHQSLGDRPPVDRFRLAARDGLVGVDLDGATFEPSPAGVITRRVDQAGRIGFHTHRYAAGRWLAGELVEVRLQGGLIELWHHDTLIASHARRHDPAKDTAPPRATTARRPRVATIGSPVIRKADPNGTVSFAGTGYRAGRRYARRDIEVALVAGSVQLSVDGNVVAVHAARHDPAKEHGAFATPRGRPRKKTAP
jgi:transposase InsO family protein